MADVPARTLSLALSLLLPLACGGPASPVPPEAGVDADSLTPVEAGASAGCRFASKGNPSALNSQADIVHDASERLSAPPGGLWWLREKLDQPAVTARIEGGSAVTLEVVRRQRQEERGPVATLRVPAALAPGTRLLLGMRTLVVAAPLPPLDLTRARLRYQARPELGGTGFLVQLPSESRGRVFVADAYVVPPYGNFLLGVKVLEWLLLSDAPGLCNLQVSPAASELFLPMWQGQEAQPFGIILSDADDLENVLVERLCPPGMERPNCQTTSVP